MQDGAFRQLLLLGQLKHVMKLSLSSGVSNALQHFWQVKVTWEVLHQRRCYLSMLIQLSAEQGLPSPLPLADRHRADIRSLLCTLAAPYSALRTVKLLPEPVLILAAVEV